MPSEEYENYLNKISKYLNKISKSIIEACELIQEKYNGNPANMFSKNKYMAPEIYFILRQLPGVGPKKASMIVRDFVAKSGVFEIGGKRLEVEGKELADVPVDIHVFNVFKRIMGEYQNEQYRPQDYWPDIQNFAKLTFPEFPAKLDYVFWSIGRKYCGENNPNCNECPLQDVCEYAESINKK